MWLAKEPKNAGTGVERTNDGDDAPGRRTADSRSDEWMDGWNGRHRSSFRVHACGRPCTRNESHRHTYSKRKRASAETSSSPPSPPCSFLFSLFLRYCFIRTAGASKRASQRARGGPLTETDTEHDLLPAVLEPWKTKPHHTWFPFFFSLRRDDVFHAR